MLSKTIGCKFCNYHTLTHSWEALFSHSLGIHPLEYQTIQEWLNGKILNEQEQLVEEWNQYLA